ncbi:hypothetical protein B0H16DRAFT_1720865 [Mycena metata]|uniref:Endo-1,3(4)-beta-glucanase 1 carbohydrate binding domain-containing protein n=1 Tax=Mycena metata TaxID=1033252 RepID=A0AAD7NF29_9AGAR|nr:hypothetical protein B0H16DRAFT_1720865 [Mycena metata]
MARLFSIVFTALASCSIVVADQLLHCGASNYFVSQYTCFDDFILCPILNGTITLPCGVACDVPPCDIPCYDPNQYSCSDNTLEFYNPNGVNALDNCSFGQYDPSQES